MWECALAYCNVCCSVCFAVSVLQCLCCSVCVAVSALQCPSANKLNGVLGVWCTVTQMLEYRHIHIYTNVYIYVYIYMFIRWCASGVCGSPRSARSQSEWELHIYRQNFSCLHMYIHIYIFIYVYIYIYVYTYTSDGVLAAFAAALVLPEISQDILKRSLHMMASLVEARLQPVHRYCYMCLDRSVLLCVLQCVLHCVLQCVWQCVLQFVAMCCSMLQCVAACCNESQCVAVCCSMLQCFEMCLDRQWVSF